jgi:hypothetical protein
MSPARHFLVEWDLGPTSPPRSSQATTLHRLVFVGASLLATSALSADLSSVALAREDTAFFDAKIRPILTEQCYKCHSHSADKIKAGLLLDSRDALLHGGNSGPAIVPGKPDESLLIQALRYTDEDLRMPPEEHGGKLSDHQIADFTEWVRRGAPDPRGPLVTASGQSYGGVGKKHWAFQPVQKPTVPAVKNKSWIHSPVDNFVLARLEASGLSPNPIADKRTLIRRVTFDLTGLPPTEPEIQRFLADESADAFAKVVDRLLDSPAYGERWARYWMDVARYSDTKGDPPRRDDPRFPHAWTYRDYLIDSFNRDKPYAQFITEQLAADFLIKDATVRAQATKQEPPDDQSVLAALGFLRLGNQHDGRRNDIIDDRIDVTTKAFLGLTVSCARCHDHKFDPIPTKDYYSLFGVFANSTEPKLAMLEPTLATRLPVTPELTEYLDKGRELIRQGEDLQNQFQEMRRNRTRDPQKRRELARAEGQLQREIGNLEMNHPGAPARAHTLTDVPKPRDYPVLIRGEVGNTGDLVPRRFLEILSADPNHRPAWRKGSGRLELAQAIADPKNPMTARVLVNRIWQQHFGAGFVGTPDDLGNMGGTPTHPELLDWLAANFVESGWSIKQLHRTMLLTSTYQQSSEANPAALAADPDNRLLWHFALRRLDFEEVYDSLLAISGSLDRTLGGKPITASSDQFGKRRAIYFLIDRRNPPELLTQFDFPNPDTPTGKRFDTTVPQQSLFLMNSPLVVETARKLTHRPAFETLDNDESRVTSLYLAIFQREPTTREINLAVRYVRANPAGVSLEPPPETPARQTARERQREQRQAQRAAMQRERPGGDQRPIGATIEQGGPIDAWTKLAHALMQTNEAMFVN